MTTGAPHQCPVCRARFRGATECFRCGADLTRPMLLALSAHRLRNTARAELRIGDYARAASLAETAQAQCPQAAGRNLLLLAQWLDELRHQRRREK